MELILASTSPYRRRLLTRLQLPFSCVAPEVDETPRDKEPAAALAQRLANAKAEAVCALNPQALVIGSDQVASLKHSLLGKPGHHGAAREQLLCCSGATVVFHTAVSVACRSQNLLYCHTEPFEVRFRALSERAIEDYLLREQPYDCAGSFKWEGLGITLFEYLRGADPTALEGLPLIALSTLLARAGLPPINY